MDPFVLFVVCSVLILVFLATVATYIFKPFNLTRRKRITFGQSASFKSGGPVENGNYLREGILAAFHRENWRGGIGGHALHLISMDDGYEPARASANINRLINELNVFAIISPLGTPTTKAFLEQIIRNDWLLIGPHTGAGFLRKPFRRNIVNVRMSYAHEISAIAFMLKRTNLQQVAVFYQNDSYGKTILHSMEELNDKDVINIRSRVHYQRNTTNVMPAVDQLLTEAPDVEAVVMAGTSAACAKFIRLMKEHGETRLGTASASAAAAEGQNKKAKGGGDATGGGGGGPRQQSTLEAPWDSHYEAIGPEGNGAGDDKALGDNHDRNDVSARTVAFFNVSVVGAETFAEELGEVYENIYVTQCVPSPTDRTFAVVRQYLQDLQRLQSYFPSHRQVRPSFASFDGYLTGRLASEVIRTVLRDYPPSQVDLHAFARLREQFMDTLYRHGVFAIDRLRMGPYGDNTCSPISAGCPCNQGIHSIYMSQLQRDRSWRVLSQYQYNVACNNTKVTLV